ncbi:MAG: hypothetical protein K8R63_10390 [Bacteroidales bacterium]|nr:hypothetical protein [Bacteroidales bacterium]
MKKLALTLLISSFIITASTAQQPQSSEILKLKKWSIGLHLGWIAGGPSKQIEEHMIQNGFNNRSGGGWFGGSGKDHPYTYKYIPSLMMSVKYYLRSPFSIGIVGGISKLGSTHGYKIDTWGHYLQVDYSVYFVSPVFSYNSYDIVKIGIGPAVYFTKTWESGDHIEGPDCEYKQTKVGFLIDFGLRIPKKTRCFFELNVQYRYVGNIEIGPFNEDPYRDELPQTTIRYNHVLISQGFGVRF